MIAPSRLACWNSAAGVSFDENMIASPAIPAFAASKSSGSELQSAPSPSARKIFRMYGLGVALTAKYSLNPATQPNARWSARALARIARSS
jgi:hypothetical protein